VLLSVTRTEEPRRLRLEGELDLSGEAALQAALDELIRQGGPITLDLSELRFMDSTGLRVMLQAAGAMDSEAPLVLLRPTGAVMLVLEISVSGAPGLVIRDEP
jgi:anti-anti-sigma factor